MKQGIIILCVKKPTYAAAAFNLALSIRFYSPQIHITLLSDGIHRKVFQGHHFAPFNLIKDIPQMDVAESKLSISEFTHCEHNLYVDADSICLKDITPIFEQLNGSPFKCKAINGYTNWTSPETFESFFGVKPGITINSSWLYFEKPDVFKKGLAFYKKGFPKESLTDRWGGHIPDEMFFNAAIAELKVNIETDADVMFFEVKGINTPISAINNYFITFHGNQYTSRLMLRDYYDRVMNKICKHYGIQHKFKMHDIIHSKLVNEK